LQEKHPIEIDFPFFKNKLKRAEKPIKGYYSVQSECEMLLFVKYKNNNDEDKKTFERFVSYYEEKYPTYDKRAYKSWQNHYKDHTKNITDYGLLHLLNVFYIHKRELDARVLYTGKSFKGLEYYDFIE